jgi:hypothetical protein
VVPDSHRQPLSEAESRSALRLRPDSVEARFNLGLLLAGMPSRAPEASGLFEAVLQSKPDLEPAQVMLERLRAAPR